MKLKNVMELHKAWKKTFTKFGYKYINDEISEDELFMYFLSVLNVKRRKPTKKEVKNG